MDTDFERHDLGLLSSNTFNKLKSRLIEVFGVFTCDEIVAVYGTADYLFNQLNNRFSIDDHRFVVEQWSDKVFDYFAKKVIPHKVEVYRAGEWLIMQRWVTGTGINLVKFNDLLYIHDLSKFSSAEAFGYAFFNFGGGSDEKEVEDFERAWHHHKMNNPHHPEYWLNPNRSGVIEPLEMPKIYVLEMIADWIGAGKTYGTSLKDWLPENIEKFFFHHKTVDFLLHVLVNLGFVCKKEGPNRLSAEKDRFLPEISLLP